MTVTCFIYECNCTERFSIPELEKFMDVSKTPNLVPYVQKLVTCRQRIENINQNLTVINARVERMQKSVVTKQY